MDDPMQVEVLLLQPARIDTKIVLPTGKPILISPEIRDQLVASGAVLSDHIAIVTADEPGQFAQDVAAEGEAVANAVIDAAVEKALQEQAEVLGAEYAKLYEDRTAMAAEKALIEQQCSDLRREVLELEQKLVAALSAQDVPEPQTDTTAAKTTSKKGAAPKG